MLLVSIVFIYMYMIKNDSTYQNVFQNVRNTLFTKGSLNAMRFLTATQEVEPNCVEDLSRELFLRVWAKVRPFKRVRVVHTYIHVHVYLLYV